MTISRGLIKLCYVLVILGFLVVTTKPAGAQNTFKGWLPEAAAPYNQFAGAFTGEFDQRTIGNDEVNMRRMLFRLGWTPVTFGTVWIEGGVANLELFSYDSHMTGDYGAAFGGGAAVKLEDVHILGLNPFLSVRGTYLVSRLEEDRPNNQGILNSRRSRYEWQEVHTAFGFCKSAWGGMLFGGANIMMLFQGEKRHVVTGTTADYSTEYYYESGLVPGVKAGYQIPLQHRLSFSVTGEVYASSYKILVSIGQWGAPLANR